MDSLRRILGRHYDSTTPISSAADPTEISGPLAEFAALRQEIDQLTMLGASLFIFQLTAAGSAFAFVLADPTRRYPLLLAIPTFSYLLAIRYATMFASVIRLGRYIREVLSPKVPGGLYWEEWNRRESIKRSHLAFLSPSMLAFPGIAVVALVAFMLSYFPAIDTLKAFPVIGLAVLWLINTALTISTIIAVAAIVRAIRSPAAE